jgi:hypothetical protein
MHHNQELSEMNWWKRFFVGVPREPRYGDFISVSRNGTVSVDLFGWWRTEPGRKELEKQCEELARFEALCRARSPDGSFSFYD